MNLYIAEIFWPGGNPAVRVVEVLIESDTPQKFWIDPKKHPNGIAGVHKMDMGLFGFTKSEAIDKFMVLQRNKLSSLKNQAYTIENFIALAEEIMF